MHYLLNLFLLNEIIINLPSKTNVMIGNSLPIRDLDNFISYDNNIEFYFNRGASGIDGVTSTALGIAIQKFPTILVTGDLSFLHDLNALMIAKKYSIPLTVFLINNNGGAIFRSLPVSSEINIFEEFFITPHELDIGQIVKSFGLNFKKVNNINQLINICRDINSQKNISVVEIRTDSIKSQNLRETIYSEIQKSINKIKD